MPEVKVCIGKLMLMKKWAISIDVTGKNLNRSFGLEMDEKCKQTAPFPGKILSIEEVKDLHQLLESVINEWESNVE